jgi:predicted amidophosphoribosyltransferase
MAVKRCGECGAELRLGPARCPLCGTEPGARAACEAPVEPENVDHYQSDVRRLREQLKKLREEDAEAV